MRFADAFPPRAARIPARAALALVLVAVGCGGSEAAVPRGWQKVEPGGRTACARGGKYAFWIRHGDPKRLLVFFQGGGGCFDETTCALGSRWFDDRVDAEDAPRYQDGVLDMSNAENPFRGWSVVYIPSCSGDVHVGDAAVTYGSIRVQQRGWVNAHAALARAYREFSDPDVVFVTGCSAGSVGSAFHADAIVRQYSDARVTQVGDSLAFLFHRPISLADWGANRHFPPFFRIGNRRWTMVEFVTPLARAHPRLTFARFNHAEDGVQEDFYEAVGGDRSAFPARLRAAESALKRLPNYRSYLACGSEHCAFPTGEFYTLEVDGIRLRDWVADLARGRDVECPACR